MTRNFKNVSTVYLNKNSGEIITSSELNNETDIYRIAIIGKKEWRIVHNLEAEHITVQVFADNEVVIPDNIEFISKNELYISFSEIIDGHCVLFPHYNTIKVSYSTL